MRKSRILAVNQGISDIKQIKEEVKVLFRNKSQKYLDL